MVDPFGLSPNVNDARTLDQFLGSVRQAESDYKEEHGQSPTPEELLDWMAEHRQDGDKDLWVYIYTEQAGWIDTGHFLEAASLGADCPDQLVVWGGELVEIWQALWGAATGQRGTGSSGDNRGGEDLSSNERGAEFGDSLTDDSSLESQLRNFLTSLGAKHPSEAPDFDKLPQSEFVTEHEYQTERRWAYILSISALARGIFGGSAGSDCMDALDKVWPRPPWPPTPGPSEFRPSPKASEVMSGAVSAGEGASSSRSP